MRRKTIIMMSVVAATILQIFLSILLVSGNTSSVHTHAALALSLIPTPSKPNDSSSGLPPIILVALIGFGGIVVGGLITGGFTLYQTRRNAQLERERLLLQLQTQHQQAQEILRLQKELEEQSQAKERERQRKEMKDAAALEAMQRAETMVERIQAYRDALRIDPRIARLQILDMSHPLEVTDIYVRVRLHQGTRPSYELDPELLEAEAQRDPNKLLQTTRKRLEALAALTLNPEDAIRNYPRCVILGDPGAGKSTLLKYLALKSATGELPQLSDLPIHIELNAFASSGYQDLLEFAAKRWDDRYIFPQAEAYACMEEHLSAGKGLFLLDALDETVVGETVEKAEESYQRVSQAILRVATRYHRSPIVVTARKAGYHQRIPLSGFTELEVLDFRPRDIEQFVNKWFACYTDPQKQSKATELNTQLERNPRLQTLAANPLLLSLIVIVYEAQLDLPERRAELYKLCVETLLNRWDTSREIHRRREFKPEQKRQLLEEIAWHFHLQGRRYFPEQDLLMVIADFLPAIGLPAEQNGSVLAEIAAENGLLKEQARQWHGFLHLTLQEYFVAQHVTDQNLLNTMLEHCGDPWWEEVILLHAGSTPNATFLLQILLGQESNIRLQEDFFFTNLILAGRCLVARPTVRQSSLRKEVIDRLFDTLLRTPYSLTQQHLAETLAEIGGGEVLTRLLHTLSNEQLDTRMRIRIAGALSRLGERSLAPDLVALLSNEHLDTEVRLSILDALITLGEISIAPDLATLLFNKQLNVGVRKRLINALTSFGNYTIAPQLVTLLSHKQLDTEIYDHIDRTLHRRKLISKSSIASYLFLLLFNKQLDINARSLIASALAKSNYSSVAPDLVALLSNEHLDTEVRTNIANNLATLTNDDVTVHALVACLFTSDIADTIYRTLWTISLRMGIRIVRRAEEGNNGIEIVKL